MEIKTATVEIPRLDIPSNNHRYLKIFLNTNQNFQNDGFH